MTKNECPHPPGSDQAILDGCKCPVPAKSHGKGLSVITPEGKILYRDPDVYWIDPECELHKEL